MRKKSERVVDLAERIFLQRLENGHPDSVVAADDAIQSAQDFYAAVERKLPEEE